MPRMWAAACGLAALLGSMPLDLAVASDDAGAPGQRLYAPSIDPSRSAAAPLAPHIAPPPRIAVGKQQRPALWRVGDADSTVWLFGSIHALPPGLNWRREDLLAAYRRARVVYFETDQTADGVWDMTVTHLKGAAAKDGVNLTDRLTREGRMRFLNLTRARKWVRPVLERLNPWYVAMNFPFAEPEGLRGAGTWGVDNQLFAAATQSGKEIRAFLSGRDQMSIFTKMPMEHQVQFLEHALASAEAKRSGFEALVEAWITGDVEGLALRQVDEEIRLPEPVLEALLDRRNESWADEIDRFLREETGEALVIGGAGHFAGERSVQAMLQERGWQVLRLP